MLQRPRVPTEGPHAHFPHFSIPSPEILQMPGCPRKKDQLSYSVPKPFQKIIRTAYDSKIQERCQLLGPNARKLDFGLREMGAVAYIYVIVLGSQATRGWGVYLRSIRGHSELGLARIEPHAAGRSPALQQPPCL